MKKIMLGVGVLVLIIIVVLIGMAFRTNVSGATTEIILRMAGRNLRGSVDWSGNSTGPRTWDIAYTDLTKISTAVFDPNLMTKIGTTQNEFTSYGLSHPDNQVYVVLSLKDGDLGYTPDLVTEDKENLTGKIFIKGRVDGGSGPASYEDKTLALNMVYDGIQNSQEILPLTDLFSVYLVSTSTDPAKGGFALVRVDKNGNSSLEEIQMNGKTCIRKWHVDFSDTECWKDLREQNQSKKKYYFSLIPLLIQKITN